MYKYYMEVESNEHYYNAYELAKAYNIMTNTDKPHSRFVARLLSEQQKKNNYPKLYYHTAKGEMMRVYASYEYEQILNNIIKEYEPNKEHYMEFSNKKHYFIIKKGEFIC